MTTLWFSGSSLAETVTYTRHNSLNVVIQTGKPIPPPKHDSLFPPWLNEVVHSATWCQLQNWNQQAGLPDVRRWVLLLHLTLQLRGVQDDDCTGRGDWDQKTSWEDVYVQSHFNLQQEVVFSQLLWACLMFNNLTAESGFRNHYLGLSFSFWCLVGVDLKVLSIIQRFQFCFFLLRLSSWWLDVGPVAKPYKPSSVYIYVISPKRDDRGLKLNSGSTARSSTF